MSATPRPITPELLDRLFVGFRNEFSAGLKMAESQYKKIAMTVPSTTAENVYGWLDQAPGFREWLNERVIKQMKTQGYSIKNRTWEDTVSISR
ncbi:Mu-like prophage major head subunit gpT family protein, partial [Salmonella enterica]|nr:Mu-like prophage major head subunit gpT family protein [Salmonella enterica]